VGRLRDRIPAVRALALVALAGCVSITDDTGTWEPAESITGALAAELGPVPSTIALPRRVLRVATWNVHFGADPEDLATQILGSAELASAEVVMIQEIEAYPGEPTRTRRLAEALGMTWVYAPARSEGGGTHGIAMLSRFPLEAAAVRRLPHVDQPIRARDRNALAAEVVLGTTRLRLVNLHLDVRIGPVDRIRQLHPAVVDPGDPVVIGGDFNTNPWAWVEATVPLTGTEAIVGMEQAAVIDDYMFERDFDGAIPVDTATLRVPLDVRIDNLYSRGLPIIASGVEHVDGSDHWPVWFDLALD